jgi:hypothetical protein
MARIEKGLLLFDPRTVEPSDDQLLLDALQAALGAKPA